MKYKALVMGKYNSVIDDFFIQMDDELEVVSCSTRYGDIVRHIKYFAPDVLVYCLHSEDSEIIKQMVNIKPMLKQSRTPFVIIGTKEDCVEFNRIAVNVSDMDIMRPFTANSIKEGILRYMNLNRPYLEENGESSEEQQSAASNKDSDKSNIDIDSLKNVLSSLDAALNSAEESSAQKTSSQDEPTKAPVKAAPSTEYYGRKHILVVDDDPIMLKTVKEQLRDDYDVATAISGKIAMKFLERKKTDLILLDYEMPGETGPEVLEKIRDNASTKDIPVVFLTGVSDKDKIQEAIALRPKGYLLKPIDHDKLMATITSSIG